MKAIKEIGIKKVIKYLLFSLWQYLFKLMFISPLRVNLLRASGARIGKNTVIETIEFMNLYRKGINGLSIGDNCFLGDGVRLDLADSITLENDVTLSAETLVLTHTNVGYKNHPLQKIIKPMKGRVVFKRGCFVGVRAVILPGVTVGDKSAVAATSLVKEDVNERTIVGGVPAKLIKKHDA